jgi:hypothetical protein
MPKNTEKKERKSPAETMSPEDVYYISENLATASCVEIASKLGITKNQVNRVRNDILIILKKYAEDNPELEPKITKYITEKLRYSGGDSNGDKKGGSGKKGSSSTKSVVRIVDNLLTNL